MERAKPTYAAELEARRRRREAQRRMQVRRARAIAALIGIVLLVGLVVLVWAVAASGDSGPAKARKVDFASPVDLTMPAVLYAKDYAAKLPPPRPPGPEPLVPAPGAKTIIVDKGDQTVTLYEADGTPAARYRCSTGHTYPRVGTYKVTDKREASSYPADGSRFYHFVIFTKSDKGNNIGFHSEPIDKDGNIIGTLGQPESHGCVRLLHANAESLYKWAKIGTKVIVRK